MAAGDMTIHYEIDGDQRVEHQLLGMAARAVEPRPVLAMIARSMREMEQSVFETAGHGDWPPLAESTLRQKARQGYSTAPNAVLIASGELVTSLTSDGGDHIEHISGDGLDFGTADPKAIFHMTGTSKMPARPPLQVRPDDTRRFTREIQRFIVGLEGGLGQQHPVGLK